MYQAQIVSAGDKRYHAKTSSSHAFYMSSDGSSANPVDTLLASLCGCLGHYVGDFLHQEHISFSDYIVRASCDLTNDRTRLGDIHVHIEIHQAKQEWNETISSAMQKFIMQCYIHNSLKANAPIPIEIVAS
jgi:uncharacterized OsmC-like protein